MTTTTNLNDKLTRTEANNSCFESEIRSQSFAEIPLTGFQPGPILNPATPDIHHQFPHTSQHNNQRLVGHADPKKNSKTKRIAVLFSGGPAAGGHNVICGIARQLGTRHTLLGVQHGPKGLLAGHFIPVTPEMLKKIANTGGFDCLGTDRTKIKTQDQINRVRAVVTEHQLDGIIIVGGDDSNTNAAILAEALYDLKCAVVGVPKTIDGDLQLGSDLPISFGFDTATKIYAELVGNILQDTRSSLKYWHFVRLMGRSASHVTLEVALQTKPALTLISEAIEAHQHTLSDIIHQVADTIEARAKANCHHGVILIPEGLIEHIHEFNALLQALDREAPLDAHHQALYDSLPPSIQAQLTHDRDSHGNVQVSMIQTETIIIDGVAKELQNRGVSFAAQTHFFGYEGRCGAPTMFDAWYCLNLGRVAAQLALDEHTGYMAAICDFESGGKAQGIPLTALLHTEERHGSQHVVIAKAKVTVDSPAYQYLIERQPHWAKTDCFSSPGPRQLWGPTAYQIPMSVALNQHYSDYCLPTAIAQ
jgi:pyrophosphate--fructose-6-phosphate 1-phosphotransferase